MRYDDGELLVTAQELAAVAVTCETVHGALSVIPAALTTDDDEHAARTLLDGLDEPTLAALRTALATLADPARVAVVHYTLADEAVSRQIVAWPQPAAGAGRDLAFLARSGGTWRLGQRPAVAVRDLVAQVLGGRRGMERAPVGAEMSGAAVLALLGTLEQLRLARHASHLTHRPPEMLVSPAAVAAVLGVGTLEDFRSPLHFAEKLFPVALDVEPPLEDVERALDELVGAGLLDRDPDTPALVGLTPTGDAVADAVFHEVSKVGLRISEVRPDGVVGHDVLLLIRGAWQLVLLEVDGAAGAVAMLDADQFDLLLERLFAPPGAGRTCAACGAAISPTVRFCTQCGVPVATG